MRVCVRRKSFPASGQRKRIEKLRVYVQEILNYGNCFLPLPPYFDDFLAVVVAIVVVVVVDVVVVIVVVVVVVVVVVGLGTAA